MSLSIIRYYHTDQNGVPQELTDSNGHVRLRARYRAWGNTKPELSDGRTHTLLPASVWSHQPLRLQGQYFDQETGVHYNQHRYYDPDSGRFMTQDPIRLIGGTNLYRYAPNPIVWIDPLGLQGVNLNLAGLVYMSTEALQTWLASFQHSSGFFSVLAHGTLEGVLNVDTGEIISPQQLAQRIRNSPGYQPNQTILLLACHLGAERNVENPQNSSYAYQLAHELGQPVMAANAQVDFAITTAGADLAVLGGNWIKF